MIRQLPTIVLLSMHAVNAQAQIDPSLGSDDPSSLEDVADDDAAVRRLSEDADELRSQPIDLNRASVHQLVAVPGIGIDLAKRIAAFRTKVKHLISLEDLERAGILPGHLAESISSFILVSEGSCCSEHVTASTLAKRPLRLSSRYLSQEEFDGSYVGSPLSITTRVRYRSENLRAHVTSQKDSGEAVRFDPADGTYAMDFVSGSLEFKYRQATILLGDYSVVAGGGLALGRPGFGSAPSRHVAGVRFAPWRSSTEHGFFRGAAVVLGIGDRIDVSTFISRRRLDGTLSADSSGVSIATSGLHRTAKELAGRRQILSTAAGLGVVVGGGRVSAYSTAVSVANALSGGPGGSASVGETAVSAGGQFRVGLLDMALEAALDVDSRWAFESLLRISGALAMVSLTVRLKEPSFKPSHSAWRERSRSEFDIRARGRPARGVKLEISATARRSSNTNRSPFLPTARHGWAAAVTFSRVSPLTARLRVRTAMDDVSFARTAPASVRRLRGAREQHVDVTCRVKASKRVAGGLEIRTADRREDDRRDLLTAIGGDVQMKASSRLGVSGKVLVFGGSDRVRIYSYEKAFTFGMSIPSFSGTGFRWMVHVDIRPASWLRVEMKYAVTNFADRTTIGSGIDAIAGSGIADIGVQVIALLGWGRAR